jgi:hypothetical protein
MESENVKILMNWLEEEIEKAQSNVVSAKRNKNKFGMYEDCGDFYNEELIEAESALKQLLKVKNKADEILK